MTNSYVPDKPYWINKTEQYLEILIFTNLKWLRQQLKLRRRHNNRFYIHLMWLMSKINTLPTTICPICQQDSVTIFFARKDTSNYIGEVKPEDLRCEKCQTAFPRPGDTPYPANLETINSRLDSSERFQAACIIFGIDIKKPHEIQIFELFYKTQPQDRPNPNSQPEPTLQLALHY
ncbi:MAG TPA: hypothetical protein VJJ80_03920 [Patescibacteria group bacterium]|nr:hypothetical protein [Patescibacteria group bacterium]